MTPDSSRPVIHRVEVVMPVHDEEHHLGPALAALRAAADALMGQRPSTAVGITVVLDHCTDRSPAIAARFAGSTAGLNIGVRVLHRRFRNAGASRAAGVAAALGNRETGHLQDAGHLESPGHLDSTGYLESTWLANTDADSRVPADWLVRQLKFADAGWDVVLGSVEPDSAGMDPELLRSWRLRHPPEERHGHVYGANLGVRASAYRQAGGFSPLRSSEDSALVEQLRGSGFAVMATDSTRVLTSGRTVARAPLGFGASLRALGVETAAALRSS
ncbi:glycosyltransferase family 2 protein [Arthrobacter sp. ISL-65]|uniref:glycosyltransferase n=1 Tax=Arthrobacter sp. ISL-65 TaxID=2819112 RepID=UPI001BE55B43|nr:glycosyltransferase [Arthrobacter sp. ISL-65]MBT2547137.1 glycosyltransferase [Arthrobacter sp. ISL-65]